MIHVLKERFSSIIDLFFFPMEGWKALGAVYAWYLYILYPKVQVLEGLSCGILPHVGANKSLACEEEVG